MRIFITILLVGLLAACSSKPVTLTFGDKENPNRVTAVSGLKSHDAANVMGYSSYTDAQVKKPQKAVCSLKAAAGKELKIDGLSEFTCWAPETDQMARPVQAEGELMQAARAFREGVGGTIKDATPVLLGAAALEANKDNNKQSTRRAEIDAETERSRNEAQAEQNASLIQGLKEKPQVIFATPHVAPTTPAPADPTPAVTP